MIKRPEMFILRTQLHFRIYQKLEFTQEVSIQYPVAAYKLHTVFFATDFLWRPKDRERVNSTDWKEQKVEIPAYICRFLCCLRRLPTAQTCRREFTCTVSPFSQVTFYGSSEAWWELYELCLRLGALYLSFREWSLCVEVHLRCYSLFVIVFKTRSHFFFAFLHFCTLIACH